MKEKPVLPHTFAFFLRLFSLLTSLFLLPPDSCLLPSPTFSLLYSFCLLLSLCLLPSLLSKKFVLSFHQTDFEGTGYAYNSSVKLNYLFRCFNISMQHFSNALKRLDFGNLDVERFVLK